MVQKIATQKIKVIGKKKQKNNQLVIESKYSLTFVAPKLITNARKLTNVLQLLKMMITCYTGSRYKISNHSVIYLLMIVLFFS